MGSKQYRLTKVRNRQAVWLPAVQPVVMLTAHWAGSFIYKIGKKMVFSCYNLF